MVQPSVVLDSLVIQIVEKDRPWTCLLFAVMVKGKHLSFSSPLEDLYSSFLLSERDLLPSLDESLSTSPRSGVTT